MKFKGGDETMKKSLLVISMMLVLAITVVGCATKGDLDKVQSQQMLTGAKADQAAQDAQAAKATADAATLKAEAAATRAENALKKAEEREKIADEKAKKADDIFQKSMKK
jgi:murein lipoprotein